MAKKVKNCFVPSITYEKMYKAYLFARKGKRYRKDVILFSLRVEENILSICNCLLLGNYKFGNYKEFYVYEPKERRILAASFKDRILHTWCVKEFIEKIFVPQFISTSCACIKGKGMHKCVVDIKKAMYKLYKRWEKGYIIKMDVSKFFFSINRKILYEIISKKVNDKNFLKFTYTLLESAKEYDDIVEKGIPIGNYTSQMYGNIYLNEVDRYIKSELKCKYYYRYMDDSCIICESKEKAKELLCKINKFYIEKLDLKLNSKTNIFPLKQGIKFCGYTIKIGNVRINKRGKKSIVKKLGKIRYMFKNGEINVDEAKQMLVGHIGYVKIANVDSFVKKYFYLEQ